MFLALSGADHARKLEGQERVFRSFPTRTAIFAPAQALSLIHI